MQTPRATQQLGNKAPGASFFCTMVSTLSTCLVSSRILRQIRHPNVQPQSDTDIMIFVCNVVIILMAVENLNCSSLTSFLEQDDYTVNMVHQD